ncbi:TetR/AcrR family transcriptional regulator [Actinomadura sp. 6K520]|jgi:AcrR family transcriptional regulator|uniref:TetR/AcrR family transcriptional regulator n=1 Tax=Actinomadura sp. 6K520 TaxID=2530364 RepID=UPI00104BD6E2|nr:TetR/AcrR family transcriptional regulator [Actinomadura sp. 6K520]TDE37683.1 TetR/AcrR family transcriptional regulator [Actinomadura sp. 6K520]
MAREIKDPRNARSRRTRDAVLAATRAILEKDGFEALSIAAVAAHAGISRQAVYLHFGSRSELVTALFDFMAQQEGLTESLDPVHNAPDVITALREWARHLATYHPRLMAVDSAIDRVRHVDADAARYRETIDARQMAGCRALARRLADEGRLAEPWTVDTAADMLWSLIATDLFKRLLARGWTAARTAEHLGAMFEATFVRPPEPADR